MHPREKNQQWALM